MTDGGAGTTRRGLDLFLRNLPPEELREHFRRIVKSAHQGVNVLTLVVIALWLSGAFDLNYRGLGVVLVGFHLLNTVCRVTSARGQLGILIGTQITASLVLMTALVHFLGSIENGMTIVVYVLLLLNSQILLSTPGGFAIANVASAAYGVALWAELHGIVARPRVIFGASAVPAWPIVAALVNWIFLNLTVFYSTSFGAALDAKSRALEEANVEILGYSRDLEDKVVARTADLVTTNEKLTSKTRALEAKQEEHRTFVYAVTHDLKTPITGILLTAELLAERECSGLSELGRGDIKRITETARLAEARIRDLLNLSAIVSTPEPFSVVDLDAVAAQALELLRPQIAHRGVDVRLNPLPLVWGQKRKLGHVFGNLLSNAIDFVPPERGILEVSGEQVNGSVVICVRDNGIGIPEPYQAGIFEMFTRVPESEQPRVNGVASGTGVGLAIVRRIVEAHEGVVWVESTSGDGSRFYVRLRAGVPS